MRDLVNSLLGLGITVGLSDREAFTEQVTKIIQEYQKNPETAEKWTRAILAYLEQKRDNLNMHSAISSAMSEGFAPNPEKLDELTRAIKDLTRELQQVKSRT